ncbi:MAG TPA: hypothetical protein VGV35_19640 [Bryobacteraceae bacterium]|nr:hypothetical protein [Bryobacteraceae bacterium]
MATNPPVPPTDPVPPAPGYGTPPPAYGAPPPVKKTNPLVWILGGLGGCLVLVVICVFAFGLFVAHKAKQAGIDPDLMRKNPALAAAKIMVAANPDIEMVSTDEVKGEITVRDKKTGKVSTVSFEDAKNGKFTMKEGANTVTIGGKAKFPAWVPDYPGSEPQGAFSASGAEGDSGTFTFKTKDSSDKVTKYYQDSFQTTGLKITSNVTSQNGQTSGGMLSAQDDANKHTVTVIIGVEGGETTVAVTYATNK